MATVRENRIRRAIERRGWLLVKIYRQDRAALGAGKYVIINPHRDQLLTLEQVEQKLRK